MIHGVRWDIFEPKTYGTDEDMATSRGRTGREINTGVVAIDRHDDFHFDFSQKIAI